MHKKHTAVNSLFAFYLNDCGRGMLFVMRAMGRPPKLEADESLPRLHYIAEWAEKRNVSQADISRRLEVDKSTVFRWFQGHLPAERHLVGLAEYFYIEPSDLFRHPDDTWMKRLLQNKSFEERERIKQAVLLLLAS